MNENKPNYSTLGKEIKLTANLSDFSSRDKVNIFFELVKQLGIEDILIKPEFEVLAKEIYRKANESF